MECLDERVLFDLVTGKLSGPDRDELHRHVDGCVACRRLVAETSRGMGEDADGTASAPRGDPAEMAAPSTVDRFEISEVLGAGGMGLVYRARDPRLDRWIALKVVRPDSQASPADLLREAQALAKLAHPNVTTVFEVGDSTRGVFLAMELVEGPTLAQRIAAGPLRQTEARALFLQAGSGLAAAHARGIVHGDVKPDNILLGVDGRVRLTDFGLAHDAAHTSDRAGGTPSYLAPERKRGSLPTQASDQYAFAAALYEATTGTRWAERSAPAPSWARRVIERGTRHSPALRYEAMSALLRDLDGRRGALARRIVLGAALLGAGATAALTLGLVPAVVNVVKGKTARPAPPHPPGTIAWLRLTTLDVPGAVRFYGALLGWRVEQDIRGGGIHSTAYNGSGQLGNISELTARQRALHDPPHWLPYVSVPSADSGASAARASGGTILVEPDDNPPYAREAVIRDPLGTRMGLRESWSSVGIKAAVGSPGNFAWLELETASPAQAAGFYQQWVAWRPSDAARSSVMTVGGAPAASIREADVAAPRWVAYFAVPRRAASVEQAQKLGATVVREAFDVPGVGAASELYDPSGVPFGVIEVNRK